MQTKFSFIRALGVIIPAIMVGSVLLKSTYPIILGTLISYIFAFCISYWTTLHRFGYTVVAILVSSYTFSCIKVASSLIKGGGEILPNFYKIFLASGLLSVVMVGVLVPAWLIFLGIDYLLTKRNSP